MPTGGLPLILCLHLALLAAGQGVSIQSKSLEPLVMFSLTSMKSIC